MYSTALLQNVTHKSKSLTLYMCIQYYEFASPKIRALEFSQHQASLITWWFKTDNQMCINCKSPPSDKHTHLCLGLFCIKWQRKADGL